MQKLRNDYSSKYFSNKACFANDDYRKTDLNKLENFTSFNDAIQSFFTLKCPTPMLELKEDEMKKLFLTTGQIRMIASKNTDIISQFLEIVA